MPAGQQGPNLVGAGADVDIGGAVWAPAGNITADDAADAAVTIPALGISNYLAGTQLGFSIPGHATIVGIVIELNGYFFTEG